jgi:hypothetical protein
MSGLLELELPLRDAEELLTVLLMATRAIEDDGHRCAIATLAEKLLDTIEEARDIWRQARSAPPSPSPKRSPAKKRQTLRVVKNAPSA